MQRHLVVPEGGIVFDRIYNVRGTVVPPSHHGLPTIEPDIVCLRQPIRAEREKERADRLAARLRELGADPDEASRSS